MGFRHNNVLPANHFRKDWQRRVKTWFNQPGRKLRRRNARQAKAALLGVRPLKSLRPAVRAPTLRYNTKLREGRGFTLAELKEAGISRKSARGVGIVVDHRRRNLSAEGKALNVERLKAYKARLVVFPRNAKKPKKADSTGDDLTAATTRAALPLPAAALPEAPRKITAEEREFKAYRALREARSEARYAGIRKIRKAKVRLLACAFGRVAEIHHSHSAEGGGGGKQEEVNFHLTPLPLSRMPSPPCIALKPCSMERLPYCACSLHSKTFGLYIYIDDRVGLFSVSFDVRLPSISSSNACEYRTHCS